jgi:hypothetical protein
LEAAEPWNGAWNEKTPPSPATSQYPGEVTAAAGAANKAMPTMTAAASSAAPVRLWSR